MDVQPDHAPLAIRSLIQKITSRMKVLRQERQSKETVGTSVPMIPARPPAPVLDTASLETTDDCEDPSHPGHEDAKAFYRHFDSRSRIISTRDEGPNTDSNTGLPIDEVNPFTRADRTQIANEAAIWYYCYDHPSGDERKRAIWFTPPPENIQRDWKVNDPTIYEFNRVPPSPNARISASGIVIAPPEDKNVRVSDFVSIAPDPFVTQRELEGGYNSIQVMKSFEWEGTIGPTEVYGRLKALIRIIPDAIIMMRHVFSNKKIPENFNYGRQEVFNLPPSSRLWAIDHYQYDHPIKKIVIGVDSMGIYLKDDLVELMKGVKVGRRLDETGNGKRSPTWGEIYSCFRWNACTRYVPKRLRGSDETVPFEFYYKARTGGAHHSIYHDDELMHCEAFGIQLLLGASFPHHALQLTTYHPYETDKDPGGALLGERKGHRHPNMKSDEHTVPQPLGADRSKAIALDLMDAREWACRADIPVIVHETQVHNTPSIMTFGMRSERGQNMFSPAHRHDDEAIQGTQRMKRRCSSWAEVVVLPETLGECLMVAPAGSICTPGNLPANWVAKTVVNYVVPSRDGPVLQRSMPESALYQSTNHIGYVIVDLKKMIFRAWKRRLET